MKPVPRKYEPYVFSFFMSLLVSCVIALVISLMHVGLAKTFVWEWLQSWIVGFGLAFPTIVCVTPLVRRLVTAILAEDENDGVE